VVANYTGGSLSLLPIAEDGSLLPAAAVIQHSGSGSDPHRQEGPHVHSVNLDPRNRFVITADLGLDKLLIYRLDLAERRLVPEPSLELSLPAGAGPRHLDFHPNGRFAYLINELNSTVTGLKVHLETGRLEAFQTVPTLPAGFQGMNLPADIHVTPCGRFLYGTNRMHDSLVVFSVNPADGRLTYVGHAPTGGHFPRNFAIDPSGTFLLAANQKSGTIVTFQIDRQTGKLNPTGQAIQVPAPVCIKFLET
jgi:6-phosphogluconolactonase